MGPQLHAAPPGGRHAAFGVQRAWKEQTEAPRGREEDRESHPAAAPGCTGPWGWVLTTTAVGRGRGLASVPPGEGLPRQAKRKPGRGWGDAARQPANPERREEPSSSEQRGCARTGSGNRPLTWVAPRVPPGTARGPPGGGVSGAPWRASSPGAPGQAPLSRGRLALSRGHRSSRRSGLSPALASRLQRRTHGLSTAASDLCVKPANQGPSNTRRRRTVAALPLASPAPRQYGGAAP